MTSTCCDSHVMRVHIDGKTTFHCSKCSKIQGNQMSAGARMKRHERRQQPPELKIVATEQPDEPTVYTISEQKETEQVIITGTEIAEPIAVEFTPRYICPEHSECEADRPKDRKFGKVIHTETVNTPDEMIITRYCTCRYCSPKDESKGRYKHVERIPHANKSK